MTIAMTIDATGISAPSFDEILTELRNSYLDIFGADVYLAADSQDGEMLALFALAVSNCYAAAIATYNAFSPATAQGEGLSRVVKINGISRSPASFSTVDLLIVGQVGTIINDGIAIGEDQSRWALPAVVTIPPAGQLTVTATCIVKGAVTAPANTVQSIGTPTRGWQSVNNPAGGTPGIPVEKDAALRRRQSQSVSLPANTVLEALLGAVEALPNVQRATINENDTESTNALGLPPHSIALVVQGGDDTEIATVLQRKKTPGTTTVGSTLIIVSDASGIPNNMRFSRPTVVSISATITIKAFAGYLTPIGDAIKAAVAAYISALDIGEAVYLHRLYVPANLSGVPNSEKYNIMSLVIGYLGGPENVFDLPIAYNQTAFADIANINLVVL